MTDPSGWSVALPKYVCEKSPFRSSSVGKFDRVTVVGRMSSVNSCDAKKENLLSLVRLSTAFGMTIGRPTLYPPMFTSKNGFAVFDWMRKKSFLFHSSRRRFVHAEARIWLVPDLVVICTR